MTTPLMKVLKDLAQGTTHQEILQEDPVPAILRREFLKVLAHVMMIVQYQSQRLLLVQRIKHILDVTGETHLYPQMLKEIYEHKLSLE